MSRRLPVYLLVDTSGSMRGEPIQAVNTAIKSMLVSLRQDPHCLESVWLSVITFDIEAKTLVPLTALEYFQFADIEVPQSGATMMGAALNLLADSVTSEVRSNSASEKGDFRPLAFLMTDGSPSDTADFEDSVARIRSMTWGAFAALAAGHKAKTDKLQRVTDTVYSLETLDANSLKGFFQWVSDSVATGSQSAGLAQSNNSTLPPPPDEIQIVI